MVNDPTGRNPRRVAGDGDPARVSCAVLEQERERRRGERQTNGYGGVGTPPARVLTPTRTRQRGSIAFHRGSTARAGTSTACYSQAVVPRTPSGSTAQPRLED